MAETTLTLACVGCAYADSLQPSMNFHGASSYTFPAQYNSSRLYFKFESFPEAYKRRMLQTSYVRAYWHGTSFNSATKLYSWQKACDDFDETTLTYTRSEDDGEGIGTTEFASSLPNPVNLPADTTIWGSAPFRAKRLLKSCCMYIKFADHVKAVTFNTQYASQKPTLIVTFSDETVEYTCKGSTRTSGFVNRFIDNKFTWTLVKAVSGDYCAADPVQASAVFHWREGENGEWNDIAIQDGTMSVTVPAGTFPAGEIQWNVTGVDDYGVELTANDTYTVSTLVGDLNATPASPINGAFADPANISSFTWTNTNSHSVTTQSGAELQVSDDGTTWTDLGSVSGAAQIYSVPAGTFTRAGTYYWRVRAINVDGVTGPWSAAAEFSTVDATMYASPLHPVSEICDYTSPITFSWECHSDTGTPPQQTRLDTSYNGTVWTTRATVGPNVLSYTVPANTFPSGEVFWRVQSKNSNSVTGPWSDTVSFIAYGAPPQPSVSVDAVPFAVIRWQSSGQVAYKVSVDGTEYGPFFGTAKNYALKDYLQDGTHTASVMVQGAYGLWSPAGSVVFEVLNQPGENIALTGKLKRDAVLSWTTLCDVSDFIIYRDGVQIGHSSELRFVDRVVLGAHEWRVVNRLPGGYYSVSNTVSGTLYACTMAIAPLSGGEWLELKKSTAEYRAAKYTQNQTVSLRQFAGQIYPQAEVSPYKSMRADFDVAWNWNEREAAAAFEALIGKTVIFKAPGGECIVGMLSAWNRESAQFYRAYTVTVQRVHWRDYIEND